VSNGRVTFTLREETRMDRTLDRLVAYLVADVSPTAVNRKITEIFQNYQFLPPSERQFLFRTYVDSYKYGIDAVDRRIFNNQESMARHDLEKRFLKHPLVEGGDPDFLQAIKEGDEDALNKILGKDDTEGLNDFIYDMYEENYVDGSEDVANQLIVPDNLEKEGVDLLSQLGYSDGVTIKLDELAKDRLMVLADETLEGD